MKKEVGKFVETSDMSSEAPGHKWVLNSGALAPEFKMTVKRAPKNFEIWVNEKTKYFLWRGASVDFGRAVFIYFGGKSVEKSSAAQRDVYTTTSRSGVTLSVVYVGKLIEGWWRGLFTRNVIGCYEKGSDWWK